MMDDSDMIDRLALVSHRFRSRVEGTNVTWDMLGAGSQETIRLMVLACPLSPPLH